MANVLGKGEKIFQVIIHIFLILLALCAVLPIWILVAGSITGEQELILSGYSFIPKTLSLDAYKCLWYHHFYHDIRNGSESSDDTASCVSAVQKRL